MLGKETTQAPIPDKPKPNWLLIGLLALTVIFLSTNGFLLYQINQQLKKEAQLLTTPSIPDMSQLPSPPEPVANWQTYRNAEYGFQVDYPTGYYFKERPNYAKSIFTVFFVEDQYEYGQNHHPYLGIQIFKTGMTPYEWVDEKGTVIPLFQAESNYGYFGVTDVDDTRLARTQALTFMSEWASGATVHTMVQKNDYLFDVQSHLSGIGMIPEEVYSIFISAFKFLD